MRRIQKLQWMVMCVWGATWLAACGGSDADTIGIASVCSTDSECPEVDVGDEKVQLRCVTDFKGGYCTIPGCSAASDCPVASTCVAHTDGKRYCFRECADKAECNANRPPEDEANCSANFNYASPADDQAGLKACLPPTGK